MSGTTAIFGIHSTFRGFSLGLLVLLVGACTDGQMAGGGMPRGSEVNPGGGETNPGGEDTSPGGDEATPGGGGDSTPVVCIDQDGDGHGLNCSAGPDCDDTDSSRTLDCSIISIGGDDGSGGGAAGAMAWDLSEEAASAVIVNDSGELTLAGEPEIIPTVWTANNQEGTVSRVDARTGREVGRYASAITTGSNARPWNELCNKSDGEGNCPSRTAVDFRGDCWVANRAFGNQGTVTKIASHLEDCVDRNGDGEISTSTDLDGNGQIDLSSAEFLGEQDECILFTVDVGGIDGIPRALAMAPDFSGRSRAGNAWVGLNTERRFAEIAGDNGEVLRYVDVDLNPYGALAAKREGKVWAVNASWQGNLDDNTPGLVSIDFVTGETTGRHEVVSDEVGCEGSYGITIDLEGTIWVAGYMCPAAFGFDPSSETWTTVPLPDTGRSRGLVADADGWVWVAHSRDLENEDEYIGLVSRFRGDGSGSVERFYLPSGLDTIGVDLDADGRLWSVNRQTDNLACIDPIAGTVEEYPTGAGPYTYSDFTGHSLFLQFPRGTYRHVSEACVGALWGQLTWDAIVPDEAILEVRARVADDAAGLASATWQGPWTEPPVDLIAEDGTPMTGAFLEFELLLISSEVGRAPRVRTLQLTYECPIS